MKNNTSLRQIMDVNKAKKAEAEALHTLACVKRELVQALDKVEQNLKVEYTGEFVLLKQKENGRFESLGTFSPCIDDPEAEPEWDLCIPIPKPETYPEFQGW